MSHCLVTGASGFIGGALARRLRELGHDVTCLIRRRSDTSRLEPLGVRMVEGDIAELEGLGRALDGVETVFHLAGRVQALSLDQFTRVNVYGCQQVAMACSLRPRPPVLVVVSSLAAGGPGTPAAPRTETDADRPVSHYGRTKHGGDLAAAALADSVPTSIVRPPIVFGPGDRLGLALFRAIARTGLHFVPGRQDLPLSVVFVDDLCDALVRVAEQGRRIVAAEWLTQDSEQRPAGGSPVQAAGQPPDRRGLYYVADPQPTSYGEMGRSIAAALERRVRVLRVRKGWLLPPALAGELAAWISRRPTLVNLDKWREARAAGWVCSSERARQEFAWRPEVALDERYRQTTEWYRGEGWL